MKIGDYDPSATCIGCDKPGKECVWLETEAFAGPHCAKCLFREAKKRTTKQQRPDLHVQAG
jgi:hypothetical protein